MKTVKDLINSVGVTNLIAAMAELYPEQSANLDGYVDVYWQLAAMDVGDCGTMEVNVHHVYDDWNGEFEVDDYIGVCGVDPEAEMCRVTECSGRDISWALEYTPWKEWVAMKVNVCDEPRCNTEAKVLAHILWELTFVGYSETAVKDKADELDQMSIDIENGSADLVEMDESFMNRLKDVAEGVIPVEGT